MVSFENVKVSFNLLLNQTFFDHVIIEEHLFPLQGIFNAFKTERWEKIRLLLINSNK